LDAYLERRGLVKVDTRGNLLRNRLVLIAPADSRVSVKIEPGFPLARVLGDGRLAMASPDAVPAGKYGKGGSGGSRGYGRTLRRRWLEPRTWRAALVLVSRREAPLGIVYRTDAAVEPKVRIVAEFPGKLPPSDHLPAAVTGNGQERRRGVPSSR